MNTPDSLQITEEDDVQKALEEAKSDVGDLAFPAHVKCHSSSPDPELFFHIYYWFSVNPVELGRINLSLCKPCLREIKAFWPWHLWSIFPLANMGHIYLHLGTSSGLKFHLSSIGFGLNVSRGTLSSVRRWWASDEHASDFMMKHQLKRPNHLNWWGVHPRSMKEPILIHELHCSCHFFFSISRTRPTWIHFTYLWEGKGGVL